jgi:hypothetical protein
VAKRPAGDHNFTPILELLALEVFDGLVALKVSSSTPTASLIHFLSVSYSSDHQPCAGRT